MRSMWKGSVGFGMVNIPVKLYKSTDSASSSVSLCNIHSACGTAVKEPKYCPTCEKMLEATELQKAYPEDKKKEHCIPLDEAELDALPLSSAHTMQIDGLVDQLPDKRFPDEWYVIEPDEGGDRAFALLEAILKKTGKTAVTKITTGSKEHLCGILPTGDGLLYVMTLHWASDLRDISELKHPKSQPSEKELQVAQMLLDTLPQNIDLASYTNEYGEALKRLIEAKKQGITITCAPKPVTKEVDLIDQLMASLKPKEAVSA